MEFKVEPYIYNVELGRNLRIISGIMLLFGSEENVTFTDHLQTYDNKERERDPVYIIWPRHENTCLWDFRQSETQTSLVSYRG